MLGSPKAIMLLKWFLWLRLWSCSSSLWAQPLPLVTEVELQPLVAPIDRVVQSLELLGAPLNDQQLKLLEKALSADKLAETIKRMQEILDPLCHVGVNINPETRVKTKSVYFFLRIPCIYRLTEITPWRTCSCHPSSTRAKPAIQKDLQTCAHVAV